MSVEIPINSETITYAGAIGISIAIIVAFGWKWFTLTATIIIIAYIIRVLEKRGITIVNTKRIEMWIRGKNTEKMNKKYNKYRIVAQQKKDKW